MVFWTLQDSVSWMKQKDDDLCANIENQIVRSISKTNDEEKVSTVAMEGMDIQETSTSMLKAVGEDNASSQQGGDRTVPTSHKNMLLGMNGAKNDGSSSNMDESSGI